MREWPLIISSLSSPVLFALCFSIWNDSKMISPAIYISGLLATGLIFLFYYWRSSALHHLIFNFRASHRGREILSFAFFSIFSSVAMFTDIELFWILSFISGILMLVAIDTVYANSDKRYTIRYHNAQVFLTGLLLASFLISEPLPFIFICVIKTLYLMVFKIFREGRIYIKFFSLAYIIYLVFVSYTLFTSLSDIHFAEILTLLLIFELGMRIIFYFDFTRQGQVLSSQKKKQQYK